jgi:hypothetical protein
MKARLAWVFVLVGVAALCVNLFSAAPPQECTTLVASAAATAGRAPLLWKNRDTDQLSNKVVFVKDQPFSFLALVNAEDTSARMAWAGLNSAGFAISNSVAYNLPQEPGEQADLEGIIMADALRTCATAADFERYVTRNLGPDFGSRANFLVIDAQGGAAIFEVHNHGFRRFDAAEMPEKYLANTNFSRSGPANQGAGYLRFDRETSLLRGVPAGTLAPEFILQVMARDLGHALLKHPERAEWKNLPPEPPYWVHANYTINRASTASAIVVEGVKPGDDPKGAVMWVILGEPVTSIAIPLWVAAGQPPEPLWQGKDAPLAQEALRIKDLLRPLRSRERKEFVDLTRLDNSAGTGWFPRLLATESDIFKQAADLVRKDPSPADLAEFEKATAARVLSVLHGIQGPPPAAK